MRSTAGGFGNLRHALDEVATLISAASSDAERLDALRALHPVLCRVEAMRSQLIGQVHRCGAVTVDGSATTQAWLRTQLCMGDTGTQLRVAMALQDLPHVADAYARGELSHAHVAALTEVTRDIDSEVLAAGADKLLAEQAATLAPAAARRMAARVRDHFDPDAADRRTRRVTGEQWLSVEHTVHGCVSLQGMLAPDSGDLLLTTLNALTPIPPADDVRSPGARRADALVHMARLAGAAAPEAGGEKPHLTVTIDWPTLRNGLSEALFTPGGAWAGATLASGTPISPQTARRLACDATVIPVVLGSGTEPLDIGRATRVVSAGLRRALVVRDRGCRFPGCDRPPGWTDAHHTIPWARGGKTGLDNLVLLCRFHHTTVHEGGWRIAF